MTIRAAILCLLLAFIAQSSALDKGRNRTILGHVAHAPFSF